MHARAHTPRDVQVGVGLKPAVCLGTCDRWYAACKDEYFGHDPRWDALMPCPEGMVHGAAGSGMLLCSKLHILAADGQQLCQVAGGRCGGCGEGRVLIMHAVVVA